MSKHLKDGFTLAELLIIAPIVILVVTSIVSAMVVLTGNVLVSRASNKLLYGLHDTLARIDQDVSSSKSVLKESIDPTRPQGLNNDTTKFSTTDNKTLILNSYTTSTNLINKDKNIIFDDSNDSVMFNTVYFLDLNKTLWRRVIAPNSYEDYDTWQLPSCADEQTEAICKVKDTKLLDKIDTMTIEYKDADGDEIAIDTCTDDDPIKMTISITATASIAGREVSQSASLELDTICN